MTATYLRGADLIFAQSQGDRSYYSFNAHGDVIQLTTANGSVTRSYDYDAFGNDIGTTQSGGSGSTDGNPFRFAGEYFDRETGTYYLRARNYDPVVGRFTQTDTYWDIDNMICGGSPYRAQMAETQIRQQVIKKCIEAIYLKSGITSDEKIAEATRWRMNRLTDAEKQMLERAVQGIKTPQMTAIMQSSNLYVYCMNNPILFIDPSGWSLEGVLPGIGSGIGAGAAEVIAMFSGLGIVGLGIISGLVTLANTNYIFFAVDGEAFHNMRSITVWEAYTRVQACQNVYTPLRFVAKEFAFLAGGLRTPVEHAEDDYKYYNKHFHLNGRSGGSPHIFYGVVQSQKITIFP